MMILFGHVAALNCAWSIRIETRAGLACSGMALQRVSSMEASHGERVEDMGRGFWAGLAILFSAAAGAR